MRTSGWQFPLAWLLVAAGIGGVFGKESMQAAAQSANDDFRPATVNEGAREPRHIANARYSRTGGFDAPGNRTPDEKAEEWTARLRASLRLRRELSGRASGVKIVAEKKAFFIIGTVGNDEEKRQVEEFARNLCSPTLVNSHLLVGNKPGPVP